MSHWARFLQRGHGRSPTADVARSIASPRPIFLRTPGTRIRHWAVIEVLLNPPRIASTLGRHSCAIQGERWAPRSWVTWGPCNKSCTPKSAQSEVKSREPVKIACLCSTFLRPAELREAIACFERQDYPLQRRELIILDDAGQYPSQRGPGWQLVSVSRRFRTLGEKRNASAGLVSPDVEAYAVWDDDDIYLPWHLSAAARALEQGPWVVPATVCLFSDGRLERRPTNRMFHGAWSFKRDLFERAGRYPSMQGGEDQALRGRFEALGIAPSHPTLASRPSYIYRWFGCAGSFHLSALGKDGYEQLAEKLPPRHFPGRLRPHLSRDWESLVERHLTGASCD